MILIFSNNENDIETDLVIKWLLIFNKKVLRINMTDVIFGNIIVDSKYFTINNETFFYEDFKVIWIRRWSFSIIDDNLKDLFDFDSNLHLNNFLTEEWSIFTNYFFSKFPKNSWINDFKFYNVDKLKQLELAEKYGLKVPKYFFSTTTKNINLNEYITKPISNISYLYSNEFIYSTYTEVISNINITKENYFISFFQKKIKSKYEVRCMFIFGEIYSCGLFYEASNEVDLKQKKEIRTQPILLDNKIKKSIIKLMAELNCQIGFIDLIYDGIDYYFLEINPFGKFYFYSYNCNFNIDHKIAKGILKKIA